MVSSGVPIERTSTTRSSLRAVLALWGPGLIVMLADTDAGCLITAAQSGAQWGYALVLPQLLLVPILFMVQEITVRLGVVTGHGHGRLIVDTFGRGWGAVSVVPLVASAIGALLTEFAGVAGVGELFGVSPWVTVPVATVALLAVGLLGSYRRAERIGIVVGLAQLCFVPAMLLAHPRIGAIVHGLAQLPLGDSGYLYLLAANIGAVIMPWMIFYQQTAVVDRGLTVQDLSRERRDTAVGAVVTQGVMITVIVALAATVWTHHGPSTLNTVGDITRALAPYIGTTTAPVLVGAGILGGALVAALVVSLAGSWGLADAFGWKHSLNQRVGRSNWRFYLVYALTHVTGAALVLVTVDVVQLALDVQVMNAILLPVVLGLLLALEAKALPREHRMRGPYRWIATALCVVVMAFGVAVVPAAIAAV